MDIAGFQRTIRQTYGERDLSRGVPRTFAWFVEEVGELSRAVFREDHEERRHEFADVFAWLVSLADQLDVDLDDAVESRYGAGCPRCGHVPCACPG
ncbi:MAG: MazG nucleotide pyrophosphohydrolase domain-containing protein [Nitriliruptorales bacterium]